MGTPCWRRVPQRISKALHAGLINFAICLFSVPFTQYDITVPEGVNNPGTPFGTIPPDPPLPAEINGVPMQDVINDPIGLLQEVFRVA